ncbi:MAG: exosome complex exonuclease Rrp41 [Nanoarchaeota archaeon]|jgi:exosome complex component RRP41|nr:exosome complex exonuclease Rrp41 [Nanoarchaeota archaeon]|tara:strand:+ start:28465 stop:29163 length:699 start_codon:yes stop_codon:yes gene_type:complete
MVYSKRNDGRKFEEMRKMEAKVGVVKSADGSAMFKIGDTIAIAAVRGPRDLHPKFMQNPQKGILRCNYNMMSFSVDERIRPGPSRRSREISLVTRNALLPAVNLDEFPNAVVDVFVEIQQADAGTRCAGICAASMALADAGIPMKDLICAISIGRVGGKVLVDLDKFEEDYEEGSTDMPVAMLPRKAEVSLLQLDGEIKPEEIDKALELAKKSCQEILEIQKKALKEKYQNE